MANNTLIIKLGGALLESDEALLLGFMLSGRISGENVIDGAGGDTDEDGVPQVTAAGGKHGTAMVMAAKALITEK